MSRKSIVGIDEAGRGPLAGPVVAAAVILPYEIEGLADSKQLSAKKREFLYEKIINIGQIGIGISTVEEIDQINILQATMLAMQRAYNQLACHAALVLVDGNYAPKIGSDKIETIIQGDAKIPLISAASIIAKVTRDRIMQELDQEFPQYMWAQNAGYGTKLHLEAIHQHGITRHHRLSFAPIKQQVNSSN